VATTENVEDTQRAKNGLRRMWIPALPSVLGCVLGTAWVLTGGLSSDDAAEVKSATSADLTISSVRRAGNRPELNRDSPNTDQKPLRLQDLDRLIQDGSYEFAAEMINGGAVTTTELNRSQILFRQGLAEELAGGRRRALEAYHSLATAAQESPLADVGLLSAARVLINDGQLNMGIHLLMRLLISREESMHDEVRSHILHTLALGLVPVDDNHSLLDPLGWSLPLRAVTPEEMLQLCSVVDDGPEPPQLKSSFRVENITNTAGGIFVSARSQRCSVLQLLQATTHRAPCSLSVSEADRTLLDNRTLNLGFRALPFDIMLDCLLLPLDFEWTFSDGTLTVRHIDEKSGPPRFNDQTSRRFLAFAVNIAPEYRSAPFTLLRLAADQADHESIDAGEQSFAECREQFPDSAAAESASFNLGKIHLQRNERRQALECFYQTVDGVSGPELDAVAYVYIGRILLADDAAAEAVRPLMRGLSLAKTSEHEAQAAVLLAASYLMSGNPVGANSVLTKHRRAFTHPRTSTPRTRQLNREAAFLSSLARYHKSSGVQKKREAEALLAALSALGEETTFGEHNSFLVAVAFGLIGMQTEQQQVILSSLGQPREFPLQRRMSLILNQRLRSEDALDPNPGLTRVSPLTLGRSLILTQAEMSFRAGHHDEVLRLCSGLLWRNISSSGQADRQTQSDETNRAALRLMGLVYQARGEHLKAVRCLAGVDPQAM